MKYAKIKQGTEAWEKMHKVFTYNKVWGQNEAEINKFLGFPMNSNIAFEVTNLWVKPRTLKEFRTEWEKEFKKSDYEITSAKANSKIKKEWIALCQRLGLETHKTREFTFQFGLAFMGNMEFHAMDDDYLISIDNDKIDFADYEWAELIDEPTFLRRKADHLEKQNRRQCTHKLKSCRTNNPTNLYQP